MNLLREYIRTLLIEVGKSSGFAQKLINAFKTKWWDYHRASLGVRQSVNWAPGGAQYIGGLPGHMPKWERLPPDEKRLVTVAYIEEWLNNFSDSKLSNPAGLDNADWYTPEAASSVYNWMKDALSRAQTGELDMLDIPYPQSAHVAYFHTPTGYMELKIGPGVHGYESPEPSRPKKRPAAGLGKDAPDLYDALVDEWGDISNEEAYWELLEHLTDTDAMAMRGIPLDEWDHGDWKWRRVLNDLTPAIAKKIAKRLGL